MIGQSVSHYRIIEKLGGGGMGVVYKAEDTRLKRTVALKFLPSDLTRDDDAKTRFIHEAQAASALDHPNICTVHDIADTEDGQMFIVMSCYEGETLKSRIESGRSMLEHGRGMAIDTCVEYASQIAQGLLKAHEHGIIHRDIKPANLIVTSDGIVKIVDFGLAKLKGRARLTKGATTVGTLAYMSPEQARGDEVDERTDIWSLGVVLYEMLSGRVPFESDYDQAIIYSILSMQPTPVKSLVPDVPVELDLIVNKALQKDPRERFQKMNAFLTELRAVRKQREDQTRPLCLDGTKSLPSIAVLPFVNMSADPENEYLSSGLAEEIINALTRISGLRVIARTSSFEVGRHGLDIREAGAKLGVDCILEGSVRRVGLRVRVTAQLVSTRDGLHLWSDRYDRELTDILVLEDEVASAIAECLRVELGGAASGRKRGAVNHDAYMSFLEGRHHFARGTPESLMKANACYQRATELDDRFALAYDSLSELHWFLGFFGNVPPRDAFSRSTWYALRALELDDTLAETHALLGMLRKELDYNWPEVDRECQRALELNRESPLVRLRYAISGLMPHGRLAEAVTEIESVVRLDPLSIPNRWWLAVMLYFSRRLDRMDGEGQQIIALDPNHFLGHWVVGMHQDAVGNGAEAVAALKRAHELSGGGPFTLGFLAYVSGRAGLPDSVHTLLSRAKEIAEETYVPPSTFALGHLGVNEWNEAFEWWGRAIDVRDPLVMPLKSYPFFDMVRGDARYQKMLRLMNLDEK